MREFREGFDREMIVAYDGNQIAGVSILKRSPMEKRYVLYGWQKNIAEMGWACI